MADDPFAFEHATLRIGDGPEIPLAGPLKITYASGTRPDSGYMRAGDLDGEWTFPVDGDEMDALLKRANELVDQHMDRLRERRLGIDPARVIDGETVQAELAQKEIGSADRWRHGPRESEFVRPVQVLNMTTGEWMPFDGEIHQDDVEWLVWLLNDGWALDWKLKQAEAELAARA